MDLQPNWMKTLNGTITICLDLLKCFELKKSCVDSTANGVL